MIEFAINQERCTSCGLCSAECPVGIITCDPGPELTDDSACIGCQHCLAVCPTAAISVLGNDPDQSKPIKQNDMRNGLEHLITSRRSIRKFKKADVPQQDIEDLLNIVWHAPKGINNKDLLLTVSSTREATESISAEVYRRLIEKLGTEKSPDSPESEYLQWAAQEMKDNNKDIIFRGAPHFLIASSPESSPCPKEDALIAMSYFELMANGMGMGTLWDGMLKWSIDTVFPDLRERIGIPDDHIIGYAMVFGIPAVKYQRTVNPGTANINLLSKGI